jgi:hypothetical protein
MKMDEATLGSPLMMERGRPGSAGREPFQIGSRTSARRRFTSRSKLQSS